MPAHKWAHETLGPQIPVPQYRSVYEVRRLDREGRWVHEGLYSSIQRAERRCEAINETYEDECAYVSTRQLED